MLLYSLLTVIKALWGYSSSSDSEQPDLSIQPKPIQLTLPSQSIQLTLPSQSIQSLVYGIISGINSIIIHIGLTVNGVLSYLTDNNLIIDDRLLNALVLMTVLVAANFTMYNILDRILLRTSYAYPRLSHADKRYVVKNLSKSGVLLLLLLRALPALWNMFVYDQWNNAIISTIGTIYASTDLTGLLFVPNLPRATKIHHACVMVIATINVFMDYTQDGLHRAFISLTVLSMIPYLVNTYLGMRHLEGAELKRWIIKICLWVYSVSVIFNCFLQHAYVFWLVPDFSLKRCAIKAFYLMLYYFILNDDIKLIKYLHYKYQEECNQQELCQAQKEKHNCIEEKEEREKVITETVKDEEVTEEAIKLNPCITGVVTDECIPQHVESINQDQDQDLDLREDEYLNLLLIHNEDILVMHGLHISELDRFESNGYYDSCTE